MDNENFNVEFGEVVNIGGGTSDFNQLSNRPKYDNTTMTGATNIPKVPTKTSELNNDSDYQTGTEVSSAIDAAVSGLDIPTKTSDLTNDGSDGTSTYVESDDLATVATSGNYNDLSNKPTIPSAQVNADWNASSGVAEILNKPTIPTVNDATLTITQNGTAKGTFTANDADDTTIEVKDTTYTAGSNVAISDQNVISATDTTYSNFVGTDGTTAGTAGLVPAPATTDAGKFLKADGTWDTAGGDSGVVELTTDDCNWPTSNPNGIALWLLDSGMYQISSPGATIRLYRYSDSISGASSLYGDGTTFLVIENREGGNTTKNIYINNYWYNDWASNGLLNTANYYDTGGQLMTHKSVIDSLTSTSARAPLSAKQGKVLNDHIGDLSTLTTTDKTSAVAAINEIAAGGGGPTVVQTTGTSTTDVMSQNAVTSMVYNDPGTRRRVNIGGNSSATGNWTVAIGDSAYTSSASAIAVMGNAQGEGSIAIGVGAKTSSGKKSQIALGSYSGATAQGEMNIGCPSYNTYGYNNSAYRLLTGLYDGQSAHDAATVAQGNTLSTSAPTTSTVGVLGQLYTDTTNMHTYQCTAISGDTYTWTQRW